MGGRVEGLTCADLVARTPIGVRSIFTLFFFRIYNFFSLFQLNDVCLAIGMFFIIFSNGIKSTNNFINSALNIIFIISGYWRYELRNMDEGAKVLGTKLFTITYYVNELLSGINEFVEITVVYIVIVLAPYEAVTCSKETSRGV